MYHKNYNQVSKKIRFTAYRVVNLPWSCHLRDSGGTNETVCDGGRRGVQIPVHSADGHQYPCERKMFYIYIYLPTVSKMSDDDLVAVLRGV